MAKSSTERARMHRERKRSGIVIVQDIQVSRSAIDQLISLGRLDPEVADDPVYVRGALVDFLNEMLTDPEPEIRFSPRPLRRAIQAVKTISFGLF